MKRYSLRINLIALALTLLLLVLFVALALAALHFNPVTGVYSYDPRREQPNDVFLANRPEVALMQALAKQVERDGTYPATAARKLVKVEPVRVEVSTYTDWQASVHVTAYLSYQDGTVSTEVFRFHSVSSAGLFMPLVPGQEITYHAWFDRLAGCTSEGAGSSYCGIK